MTLFLSDASGGRAPADCVKAAVPRLRAQFSHDRRLRLVESRDEATLVVDVRECGSRWETKTSGEIGVGVTMGGRSVPRAASGSGTATQAGVGVQRQLSGYVILRARSADRAPEFSSLPRTDLFSKRCRSPPSSSSTGSKSTPRSSGPDRHREPPARGEAPPA